MAVVGADGAQDQNGACAQTTGLAFWTRFHGNILALQFSTIMHDYVITCILLLLYLIARTFPDPRPKESNSFLRTACLYHLI